VTKFSLPRHVGFIPDGNRRWAQQRGLDKEAGYEHGIAPGVALFDQCRARGIAEITVFCFTQDNTKRPSRQTKAFTQATVALATQVADLGATVRIVGDQRSELFPQELASLPDRSAGSGPKVNLLVNYGWQWDLDGLRDGRLRSADISRLDLIVRWGGGRRLSGFLPVQSVYADIFVCDELWPDYQPHHLDEALAWFKQQDRTLGG
jgi:undecaprenyl diphosphate synthase